MSERWGGHTNTALHVVRRPACRRWDHRRPDRRPERPQSISVIAMAAQAAAHSTLVKVPMMNRSAAPCLLVPQLGVAPRPLSASTMARPVRPAGDQGGEHRAHARGRRSRRRRAARSPACVPRSARAARARASTSGEDLGSSAARRRHRDDAGEGHDQRGRLASRSGGRRMAATIDGRSHQQQTSAIGGRSRAPEAQPPSDQQPGRPAAARHDHLSGGPCSCGHSSEQQTGQELGDQLAGPRDPRRCRPPGARWLTADWVMPRRPRGLVVATGPRSTRSATSQPRSVRRASTAAHSHSVVSSAGRRVVGVAARRPGARGSTWPRSPPPARRTYAGPRPARACVGEWLLDLADADADVPGVRRAAAARRRRRSAPGSSSTPWNSSPAVRSKGSSSADAVGRATRRRAPGR